MRRTWGYIIMAVGTLVGVAALLLPMPETFSVDTPEFGRRPEAQVAKRAEASSKQKKGGKGPTKAIVPDVAKKVPTSNTVKARTTAR